MKRIASILIVMVLISGAVFARGNMETASGNRAGGFRSTDGEEIVLSGTVIESEDHILLQNDEGIWSLSAPGFPRSGVEIPLGKTVELEGTVMALANEDCDVSADGHILVRNAAFDGEVYSFEAGRGNSGRGNPPGRNSRNGGSRGVRNGSDNGGQGSDRMNDDEDFPRGGRRFES